MENYETHENLRIPCENFKNNENYKFSKENYENEGNLRNPCEIIENHKNPKISHEIYETHEHH